MLLLDLMHAIRVAIQRRGILDGLMGIGLSHLFRKFHRVALIVFPNAHHRMERRAVVIHIADVR